VPRPSTELDVLDDQRLTAIGLLVEAEAALVRVLDEELRRDVGMSLSTYETLIRLGRSSERRLRQVELSRQLSLTTGGVTRLIDRLEAAGLVRRTPCADDRRASYAQLTEAGLGELRRATEVHLLSLQRHFVDPLGADGLAALTAPLRVLRDALVGDSTR
jgi:MarR family 2-MHQ and catechol resistance regulon transcriptional repressor